MSGSGVDFGSLLPAGLPDGREAVAEGVALGRKIDRATSLYCEEKGVKSEREWRERARERGIPTTCMNLGLSTWADTRESLGLIYEDALRRGVRPPDRFNLLAERRMGLPKKMRASAPQETGPCLWTEQDWWELTHTVPIQPEAADNMIGGPGSVENVVDALTVGATYVGVLSQYAWRWPYWDDEITQLMAVLKAAGVLACYRSEGVVFDSYLDDGYPGVFHDYSSYIGWAMLERYVSEELIGAAYSCSWGGLTQNPVTKSAVTLALHQVNTDRVPAAFLQGDTIGNTRDFDANMGVMCTDMLFAKALDIRYQLGGALLAVPLTETERIPSWSEVSAVQSASRKLDEYVPMIDGVINWGEIEALAARLVGGGKHFFNEALSAMANTGIDIRDPAQVLVAMKRLGAANWEDMFGAGEPDPAFPRGRKPVLRTDLVQQTIAQRDQLIADLAARGKEESLAEAKVVVASTDVHEFAQFLLVTSLSHAGATVIDAGVNRDPEDIVKVAIETAADSVVVTTHNGVARSFATKLVDEMTLSRVAAPIYMGGVLNEDIEGSDIPVDVRVDLHKIGVATPDSIDDLIESIGAARAARSSQAR